MEQTLGHVTHYTNLRTAVDGDATVRAYARGDLFDKRRQLMQAWAEFCQSPSDVQSPPIVVPIRGSR